MAYYTKSNHVAKKVTLVMCVQKWLSDYPFLTNRLLNLTGIMITTWFLHNAYEMITPHIVTMTH